MDLRPKLPPGRANRKALAFGLEIIRLRAAGYSFEAIRLALREAGVGVSLTTVKREAAKGPTVAPSSWQQHLPPPRLTSNLPSPLPSVAPSALPSPHQVLAGPAGTTTEATAAYLGDSRSGKAIVDEFMRGRTTNPLLEERDAK